MAKTSLFDRLLRTMKTASSPAPAREASDEATSMLLSRRRALALGGGAILTACAAPTRDGDGWDADPLGTTRSSLQASTASVGIVGAGIAGLSCATELQRLGVPNVTVYEANLRAGGRIFSGGGDAAWGGQWFERGGELIDTPHKTMQGYARALGLDLEDYNKTGGLETFYMFDGERISEATMIDEYRVLVDSMRADLQTVGYPTADASTDAEKALDRMSLAQWLDSRNAPPHIKKLLRIAYTIEYGVEPEALSCLAFLLFAKASRQSKIRLWGNFSDERYHVVGGNQQIPNGLAAKLGSKVVYDRKLLAAKKLSDGRVQLTFQAGSKTVTCTHDAVVFAIPFNILRDVQLDASLALPAWKKNAINQAVMGSNAKLMISFTGAPWGEAGCSGAIYTDLPYFQNSWETSPHTANDQHAILTDYTGGNLALSLSNAQTDAGRFLGNLDTVLPGAKARARKDSRGNYIAHLENWCTNPLTKGAYTANQPGYFTTLEGLAAKPVANLFFAGEYTDSFYEWQGFMEGGALSGLRAAAEVDAAFG